jgi:hypothetical protein
MSAVWVLQFFLLIGLTVVYLVKPTAVDVILDHCAEVDAPVSSASAEPDLEAEPPSVEGSCARIQRGAFVFTNGAHRCCMVVTDPESRFLLACIRTQAPFIFMLALFTAHAAMREDERVRRRLARVFAATCALSILLFLLHAKNDDVSPGRAALSGVFYVLFGCNFLYGVWPQARAGRPLSGSADTRPSQLWVLWLIQGLLFVAVAGMLFGFDASRYVLASTPRLAYAPVLDDLREVTPPVYLAAGLFSFVGMQASREWVWRAMCRSFVWLYASFILVLLITWEGAAFNPLALLPLIPAAVFLLGNLWFAGGNDAWFAEDVGEGADGWVLTDLVSGPLMLFRTLRSRRRATHRRGVAAGGSFHVDLSPHVPRNEFFKQGKEFKLQIRFATEEVDDDAGLDARGVAFRLSEGDESPLDLLLSTGAFSPAKNILEFALLRVARSLGGWAERRVYAWNPVFREGVLAGLRRAPECFSRLHYYSQTVRFWVSAEDVRYLVRYRLVPEDPSAPESGLPSEADADFDRARLPGERRPADYLTRQLKRTLEGRLGVLLRLQAQLHRPVESDGDQWFDPSVDWPTDEHPWLDVAVLVLEDTVSDEQAEKLRFNPGNAPSSLGTPVAQGPFDPRSIADSEKRVHRRVQDLRRWMLHTFGLPAPDIRPQD